MTVMANAMVTAKEKEKRKNMVTPRLTTMDARAPEVTAMVAMAAVTVMVATAMVATAMVATVATGDENPVTFSEVYISKHPKLELNLLIA